MGVSKERKLFLKWRNDHYPLLKSEHSESNFLWQAWQGRAAIKEESCPIVQQKSPVQHKAKPRQRAFVDDPQYDNEGWKYLGT
jgi:hypothetical protein